MLVILLLRCNQTGHRQIKSKGQFSGRKTKLEQLNYSLRNWFSQQKTKYCSNQHLWQDTLLAGTFRPVCIKIHELRIVDWSIADWLWSYERQNAPSEQRFRTGPSSKEGCKTDDANWRDIPLSDKLKTQTQVTAYNFRLSAAFILDEWLHASQHLSLNITCNTLY